MAANFIQPINLTAPTDYNTDALSIERNRQLMQALMQQGQEPFQTNQTAGGYVIPISPMQGLAKALQQGLGAYGMAQADKKEKDLAKRYQDEMVSNLDAATKAGAGTPAIAPQAPATPNDDEGNPNSMVAGTAAVPPNPQLQAALLMRHPATQALGVTQMGKQMEIANTQERLKAALGSAGMGAGTSAGAPPAGGAASGGGGPFAGMDPRLIALMTSGDPELVKLGQTVLEANKGIAQRPGAPVVNPYTGAVIAQPTPTMPAGMQLNVGPGGPQASPVPGFAAAKEGINAIPDAGAAPVKVPLSGGQEAQLSQPEFLQYQKTGALPARYGAPGLPTNAAGELSGIPANEVGAARAAGVQVNTGASRGGLGTPGLTQSQQDLINQERQKAGGKALDEQFAKDYATFVQGGGADAQKQLAQLGDVIGALKQPGSDLTGAVRGHLPDMVRNITNPKAVAMRERVEEVVQRSLRSILGAQFTENEGERLISRAYNPAQPPAENAIRVNRLFTQLQSAFQSKQDAARYYEKNGTLQGWTGKLPSLSDFDSGGAGALPAGNPAIDQLLKKYGGAGG